MTRIIIENRFRFGQFEGPSTSSSSSSTSLAPPSLDAVSDAGVTDPERGDRLSPISRPRTPAEPREHAPSHHRGHEGPTTPRAAPAPATPRESPKPHQRPSAPTPPRVERSPSPPREIGAHDFARGLAPRQTLPGTSADAYADRAIGRRHAPSIRVPPHVAAARGRGHNMVLNRGRVFLPPTGTPAEWEAAAEKRRRDFAEQMAARMPGRGPRARAAAARPNEFFTGENVRALKESAARLGLPPEHLAQAIANETIGTFSPRIWGGKGGRYMGLIQFGPRERREYGVHSGQTFREQLGSAERFLLGRGYRPGMGQLDLYSTILAGRPGLYHRRDRNGSVAQHVARMGKMWGPTVERFLASGCGVTPKTVAGGSTPQGVTPQTSTARRR